MNDMSGDWRLLNQLQYLYNERLTLRPYTAQAWDKDLCEFCSKRFSTTPEENTIQQGYVTEDADRWVCKKCYADFKGWFDWQLYAG